MGTSVEEIPSIKRRKIEETVLNILKNANLETATESSVRAVASELLSDDFSSMSYKCFIRQVLENYLLSTVASVSPSSLDASRNHGEVVLEEEQKHPETNLLSNESIQGNGKVICKLSDSRNVAIYDVRGQTFVSIQDYHQIGGKQFPSGRGISLTDEQWSNFRNSFSAIGEAIAKMESHSRSTAPEKLQKANGVSSVDDTAHQEPVLINQNHMETGDLSSSVDAVLQRQDVSKVKLEVLDSVETNIFPTPEDQVANGTSTGPVDKSTSLSSFSPQSHVENNHIVNPQPQNFVPIMTTRLNGKNYHCWVHQMEFFLKQLKVAYVLTLPCPSIPVEPNVFEEIAQAKAAGQKWIDDDYLCCHSILSSLSDDIFNEYSKKRYSAKELWVKLKFAYDEDFGTKRSLVHNYVQFEMVDGVSVVEQVQELNHIANTIVSSGIWVDENFHVSVIISKLPPSWTAFRRKLMREEYLPLNMVLQRVKAEEESYNSLKREKAKNMSNSTVGNRVVSQKKDGKRLCFICGKEGHISKYCRVRRNQKYNEDASTNTEEHNPTQRSV